MSKPLAARFWEKVTKTEGCWEWTGSVDRPYAANPRVLPYGNIGVSGNRKARAHRVSWELHFGVVPPGKQVLHRCDNARCVRPDHLVLGTQLDNMRDMGAKGRRVSSNANKTHCKRGHLLAGANLYRRPDGLSKRECAACRSSYYRRHRGQN